MVKAPQSQSPCVTFFGIIISLITVFNAHSSCLIISLIKIEIIQHSDHKICDGVLVYQSKSNVCISFEDEVRLHYKNMQRECLISKYISFSFLFFFYFVLFLFAHAPTTIGSSRRCWVWLQSLSCLIPIQLVTEQ